MAISTGMALLGSAAIGAGGALYTGAQAGRASEAQIRGAQQAGQISQAQYTQTRTDLAPWREVGEQALYQYADTLGIRAPGVTGPIAPDYSAFETSPGYLFRQQEGAKAVERSQAARGLLKSGGTLKALQRYGQGVAADAYGDYMNRLASTAGLGQTTTIQTGQLGAQAAGQEGRAVEAAGAARASGYLGQAQAVQQGISGLQSLGGYYVGQQQNQALLEALRR